MVNVVVGGYPFLVKLKVNGKDAQALADSGSAVTLISPIFVKPCELDHNLKTGITCVHEDMNSYPTTSVKVEFRGEMYMLRVGVVPKLLHTELLERDYPGFNTLVKIQG